MVKAAMNLRLKEYSSSLRKEGTKEERKLWFLFLRRYPIKFRRQKVLDGFIADFYCREAQLVIELDGSQHYSDYGKTYDQWRSSIIEEAGIRVLRFSNGDINERFEGVCIMIDGIVKGRIRELSLRR